MTAKLKGTVVWELKPGYPQVNKEDITFAYTASNATVAANIPEYGSACPNHALTPTATYGALWTLAEKPIKNLTGDIICEVTCKYTPAGEDEPPPVDSSPVFSASTSTFEKPIATHPNYRTYWNYCLARKIGCSDAFDNYQDATGVLVADAENFKWISAPNSLPENWKIVTERGKPGVEAYLYPSSVIQEKRYFSSSSSADNALADVATLNVPAKRFGLSNGSEHWMCMGASVQKEGKYWTATKTYQFMDKWDEELYS